MMKYNTKYRECISVNLVHGYFLDGKSNGFRFIPMEKSRKRDRAGSAVLYPRENGFHILRVTTGRISPKDDEVKVFDIAAYAKDPLLGNYSNLEPDQKRGNVYYIGNWLKNTEETGKDRRLTLKEQGGASQWEAVQVVLQPGKFVISPQGAAPGDVFRLKNRKNIVIKQWTVKSKTSPASFYVDTGNQGRVFLLLEKNNKPAARYYADDRLYKCPPLFIAGMELPRPGDGKNDAREPKSYDLEIATRAVTWQYHVTARSNGKRIKNLQIQNNSGKQLSGITFTAKHIDEQQGLAVFASNRPIPLTEKSHKSIELVEAGSSSTPLIPHLPSAGISSLHFIQNQWVAQMYVYI
jgi:hypothetical protein